MTFNEAVEYLSAAGYNIRGRFASERCVEAVKYGFDRAALMVTSGRFNPSGPNAELRIRELTLEHALTPAVKTFGIPEAEWTAEVSRVVNGAFGA